MISSPMPPLYSGADPETVAADLAPLVDFQPQGMPLDELRALLDERLLPHLLQYNLPAFQSMFNAFPSPEAKLGGEMMLNTNQGVTNWQVSPGGAMLEELCAQALCNLFKLGRNADATFMYSGTYANQQALYLALHRYAEHKGFDFAQTGIAGFSEPQRLAVLVSEDAHFSLNHAVRILGLGEQSLVKIPVDHNRRMDVTALRNIISKIKQSRDIFCIVATAGTTSTGAVDPISSIADLSQQTGAWLHVDGAYGYAYKLVPEYADLFAGDERADSICWDPHKQLGAPIPNSILFLKERSNFGRMALFSDYFNRAEDVEPNPGLKSPPSTRGMAALPLVTLLKGQGLDRIVSGLRVPLEAAAKLADHLETQADFEVCHSPDTGILCFRMVPLETLPEALDAIQRRLYDRVMASGERSISLTKLDGKVVLRVVSVSPDTRFEHYLNTIEALRSLV